MAKKIYLAFIWHMHQPFYKNLYGGEYAMPWVRLHAIKDYFDMVNILRAHPTIKQTFNYVPSLLEQIVDYTDHAASDNFLELARVPADKLSIEQKVDLLEKNFMGNWDNMIRIHPRYSSLLEKRGYDTSADALRAVARMFSDNELRDLQVWFNLAWFNPAERERDPFLAGLFRKGASFTEAEKLQLLATQINYMRRIIPEYRSMVQAGNIELTLSPFYHPIMPLLCDTDIARVSDPECALPSARFSHPEDVVWQVKEALNYFSDVFGYRPVGMWPSEGSVSEEIIPLLAKEGIEWIATDEGILENSLDIAVGRDSYGNVTNPDVFYRPYTYQSPGGDKMKMLFRDHYISDLFGFIYHKWNTDDAADNFIVRMHDIRKRCAEMDHDVLVPIILDGENAWEYYQRNGLDFLTGVYKRLEVEENIVCVTPSEFFKQQREEKKLKKLWPGSWINKNFRIWIGHQEDNTAWDYLSETRKFLVKFEQKHDTATWDAELKSAWREIYIAEGSDWCWWYGDDHDSGIDNEFDQLFRTHLINVYLFLKQDVPGYLYKAISAGKQVCLHRLPTGLICPQIDGQESDYFQWRSAGYFDQVHRADTMHKIEAETHCLQGLYYGYSQTSLYLRLDLDLEIFSYDALVSAILFVRGLKYRLNLRFQAGNTVVLPRLTVFESGQLEGRDIAASKSVAIKARLGSVLELEIPFELLNLGAEDKVEFLVVYSEAEDTGKERCPQNGLISLSRPNKSYQRMHWWV